MKETNKRITGILKQAHNIDVSKYDETFLNKSFTKRITETKCKSAEEYLIFLKKNEKEGLKFFDSLHISYSEFFRNPLTFAILEKIILPSLIQKKKNNKQKEIRIWSAACAAGQEAYSIAMLLEELKIGDVEKMNSRIFATDQCESQVAEAGKGTFNVSALNNMNLKRVKQWFLHDKETYTINPLLKNSIDFSVFDLFSEQFTSPPASIFGNFDIVVCANLMFYYKPEFRKIIVGKTGNCLANNGYLVVGESERDILLQNNYHEIFPYSAIFQKKI
jgi:chemotaxis protein methyltransferase CheR